MGVSPDHALLLRHVVDKSPVISSCPSAHVYTIVSLNKFPLGSPLTTSVYFGDVKAGHRIATT